MTADSINDIQHLKAIGRICAEALRKMQAQVRVGMTTRELDEIGRAFLEVEGARSAPQAMYKFPGATCISISPVIAHGIPNERTLREGELIHIDVSAELDGYYADTGASMVVSRRDRNFERLLEATKAALTKALRAAKAGSPLNGISRTVQNEAKKRGYNVIYDLTGHVLIVMQSVEETKLWIIFTPERPCDFAFCAVLGAGFTLNLPPRTAA